MAPIYLPQPPTSTARALRGVQRRRVAHSLVAIHHTARAAGATTSHGFRWYWLAWATLSLLAFLVPELTVVAEGRMDLTLSDTLRAVLGIDPPRKGRAIGAASFAVVLTTGVAILVLHITAGWPG